MSIAGGLYNAFERSQAIGGNTLQIFSKSPRGWSLPKYTEQDYAKALEYRKNYEQEGGLIHASYLANLSKNFEDCQSDINSILHDFAVAHHTGFEAVNIHVGKGKGFDNIADAYTNMTKNTEYILTQNEKNGYNNVQFLFEITAGQGSELGYFLDDLGAFYQEYLKDLPVAFCFDTAHAWGGGNDLRKRNDIISQWDALIGIDKLHAFHLNDSKAALGSRLDRHAPLGRGAIGLPALAEIVIWAAEHDKPIFLETTDPTLRPEEIQAIRKIAAGDTDWIDGFHSEHSGTHMLKKFQGAEQETLF